MYPNRTDDGDNSPGHTTAFPDVDSPHGHGDDVHDHTTGSDQPSGNGTTVDVVDDTGTDDVVVDAGTVVDVTGTVVEVEVDGGSDDTNTIS